MLHEPNKTITEALIELGLGENDAIMYQILLQFPQASVHDLQEKSPFSRTMIYYLLDNLVQFELASVDESGKKALYTAENPHKLEGFIREQEKELERQKKTLGTVLSDLSSVYRLAHHKPGVQFFEGADGFRDALYDSLTAKETIYAFVDVDAVSTFADSINKAYVKKRRELGIEKKILAPDTPGNRAYLKAQGAQATNVRFLPKEMAAFGTGMEIYDHKISYFTLQEDHSIAVVIEDQSIYDMHRKIFEYLWTLAGAERKKEKIKKPKGYNHDRPNVFDA